MAYLNDTTVTSYMMPNFIGDFLDRDHLLPGGATIDPTQFNTEDALVVRLNATAIAGATSITVSALAKAIPAGTLLRFRTGQYAYTSALAAAGATTIAVEALPAALTTVGDTAVVQGTGRKFVAAGTLLGRTRAERDAGTAFGPAIDTDEDIYLVAFDVTDASKTPTVELIRYGTVIKENKLPNGGIAALSATLQAFVRSKYECVRGAD